MVALVAATPLIVSCSHGRTRIPCEPERPSETGLMSLELQSGGMERSALLYVPASYDGSVEFPLVLNWHGYGSNAVKHMKYADLLPLADEERFLVVAPQGSGMPRRFNVGAGITSDADDVQFALDLIDRIGTELCLDHRRVYSVGVSNGAAMSAVLACTTPARFAAIGMVALLLKPDECMQPTPAVLGIMGDADLVVPIQGGRVNCCGGWPIAPAEVTMQRWADHLHCEDSSDERAAEHVERRTWHGCDDGRPVVYYLVRGGGHTWPGSGGDGPLGPTNREINASEIMWSFFEDHVTAN